MPVQTAKIRANIQYSYLLLERCSNIFLQHNFDSEDVPRVSKRTRLTSLRLPQPQDQDSLFCWALHTTCSDIVSGAVTQTFFWQHKDLSCCLLQTLQHSLLNASFAKQDFRTVSHKQQHQEALGVTTAKWKQK